MLRIVLPKGSLEKATFDLFEAADLTIRRSSSVDYKATIDDPRIIDVRILRPQEIPQYVAEGLFDIGITGRDWVEETRSDVESLGELKYSKATSDPVKVVVAVAGDSPAQTVADLPHGVRVSSEYPSLTERYFAQRGIKADVRLSYGASEAKIPDIADCIVDITETGRALRAAGLRVLRVQPEPECLGGRGCPALSPVFAPGPGCTDHQPPARAGPGACPRLLAAAPRSTAPPWPAAAPAGGQRGAAGGGLSDPAQRHG